MSEKKYCEGQIRFNAAGHAFVTSNELESDLFIHKSKTGKAFHLDTVEVEIGYYNNKKEGTVVSVIERFKTQFVGTVQISERFAFFIADNPKIKFDFMIPLGNLNGATEQNKVVAEFVSWEDGKKNPIGKVIKVLGQAGDNETEIHSILHEYNLPYEFDEFINEEANTIPLEIPQSEIDKRVDMRNILTLTIDPETAKDFDDALSFEVDEKGNYNIGVHIADVSHYVKPDTALDEEAFKRATSVYLVDRVVPMLPERLSNGVCSLRPHEDKLCFSIVFKISPEGKLLKEWIGRTVIHSDYRFTYEDAQNIIETGNVAGIPFLASTNYLQRNVPDKILNAVKELDRLAKIIRKERLGTGAIVFDKHEVKFKLDENSKPVDLIFKVSKDSNKLIEEFMLLANKRVATFVNDKNLTMVNRIHEEPDVEKLAALQEIAIEFGYVIKTGSAGEIRKSLNQLLIDVKDKPEANMIENLVIRSMQKAKYSTINVGHYGLGFQNYGHFTSPIRRYPDVMLHRLLEQYLNKKTNINPRQVEAQCEHCSAREIVAQKAERDSIKYKQAEYLMDKIGKIYEGVVTSVVDYGLFVEIKENKCTGLVRTSEISMNETYSIDASRYIAQSNSGDVIRLGDEVKVAIKAVDLERKTIDLMIVRL